MDLVRLHIKAVHSVNLVNLVKRIWANSLKKKTDQK